MGFRLVPKLVTMTDLERRNGRYFGIFGANYVEVVEDRPAPSGTKMYFQSSSLLAIYDLWRYLQRLPRTSKSTTGTPWLKAII